MNRARGPTGVCPGGYVRLGQGEEWAGGSKDGCRKGTEPAKGKEEETDKAH